jgi:hypothetical protein
MLPLTRPCTLGAAACVVADCAAPPVAGRTGHRLLVLPRRHTLLAPAVGWRLVWRQQAVARGLFSTVRCGWVRRAYAEVVEHLTPTPQDEASVSWLTCSIPRASQRLHRSRHRCVRTALFALLAACRKGCASIITKARVGFQGRGCADVVQGLDHGVGHFQPLSGSVSKVEMAMLTPPVQRHSG